MEELYRSSKVQWYNGRPVQKIEVIKNNGCEVTFKTDYPIDVITIPRKEFDNNFVKW